MDCQKVVDELNIAYKLYSKMIVLCKPYQIHKARQAYLALLNDAKKEFEFHSLRSIDNLERLVGHQQKIREIIDQKSDAIKAGDYEQAAELRDLEKKIIALRLKQQGRRDDVRFLCHEGSIFFKEWN